MDQMVQLCEHGQQYTEITKKYFQLYQNLPKALIKFDCQYCQNGFLYVNKLTLGQQLDKLDNIIDCQLNMQLTQEIEQVIGVLDSLIFQHTNQFSDYLITRVLFLIKILNVKYENSQELLKFERLFFLVLQSQGQQYFLQKNNAIKSFELNGIYNTTEIQQNYLQKKTNAAAISREFIVSEYRNKYLLIYNIEKKKNVKILKLVFGISIFIFSENQKYLFVGSNQGIIYRIDVYSGFKKIEKIKFSFPRLTNIDIAILNNNTIYVVLNGEYDSRLIQLSFKDRKIISSMKFQSNDYSFDAKNGFFHYISRVVSDLIFNNIFDIQQHPEKDLYDFVVIHSFRMQNRTLIQWDPLRIINLAKIKFLKGNKLLLSDRRRRLKFHIMTLNFKSFRNPKFKAIPFNEVEDFSSNLDGLISIKSTKDNNTWYVIDSEDNCQELYRITGKNPILNRSNKLKVDNMMIINDPYIALFLCTK